jgi:hypothetical protein
MNDRDVRFWLIDCPIIGATDKFRHEGSQNEVFKVKFILLVVKELVKTGPGFLGLWTTYYTHWAQLASSG